MCANYVNDGVYVCFIVLLFHKCSGIEITFNNSQLYLFRVFDYFKIDLYQVGEKTFE